MLLFFPPFTQEKAEFQDVAIKGTYIVVLFKFVSHLSAKSPPFSRSAN